MGLDNPVHIIFIVLILLLLFGARRLPEIGRSLGTGMREFKQSLTGEDHHPQQQTAPTLAAGPAPAQTPGQPPAAQPAAATAPAPVPQPAPVQSPAAPAQAPAPSPERAPAPAEPSGTAPPG
ncbi:MAG TPA: twin-arginine translocase TatA/TatE family subunit [Solirubrobacteraceae bacterium]|nr:twin-arginine translocase TatA/TatE family subunit [Solirubrobacteraceae bacterium]